MELCPDGKIDPDGTDGEPGTADDEECDHGATGNDNSTVYTDVSGEYTCDSSCKKHAYESVIELPIIKKIKDKIVHQAPVEIAPARTSTVLGLPSSTTTSLPKFLPET